MSTILNNQIQLVSKTRLSGLAMTSVLFHWLTTKPFVFSLYKCDTTRMVGRSVNFTSTHTSLLISVNASWIYNQVFFLNHPPPPAIKNIANIPSRDAFHLSPTYTYMAYISVYIYLQPPQYPPNIPSQLAFHYSPTYTYTAHISSIPTYPFTASLFPYIYLHSLHLFNPPHILSQPASH